MNGFQIFLAGLALTALLLFGAVWAFQTYEVYRFTQSTESPDEFDLPGVEVVKFTSDVFRRAKLTPMAG